MKYSQKNNFANEQAIQDSMFPENMIWQCENKSNALKPQNSAIGGHVFCTIVKEMDVFDGFDCKNNISAFCIHLCCKKKN